MLGYVDYTIGNISVGNVLPIILIAALFLALWYLSTIPDMRKMFLLFLFTLPVTLWVFGTVIVYDRYKTEYTICHSQEAKEKNYIYKNGYCYRKFVGYIGVDTIDIIEGEIKWD